MRFNYNQPVEIIYGTGTVGLVPNEAMKRGYSRGLLVTSPSQLRNVVHSGRLDGCEELIVATYSSVKPNPDTDDVDACVALAREEQCDFILAIGGGSVLDCAKAASVLALTGEKVAPYVGTGKAIAAEHLPLIALPTTSGTGSEVTRVAVVTDHARGVKAPLVGDALYPVLAIVDPELTLSMPPRLTACTGFDALCHCIESYWSQGRNPLCSPLAIEAARTIFAYLPAAVADGSDLRAREEMARASLTAGLAFNLPRTNSGHACSYIITAMLGLPHGEACTLTIEWFIRFNAARGCAEVEQMARALGFADADAMASEITAMKRQLGLRTDLREFNLTDEQIEQLAVGSQHPILKLNPVEVTLDDLRALYRSLR